MAKSRIQTRVDDTRKRDVDQFAAEHDITQAEAVRRLVARGIDYEAGRLAATDGGEVREATEELARTIRLKTYRDAGVAVGLVLAIGELGGVLDTTAAVALGLVALMLLAYPSVEHRRHARDSGRDEGSGGES